MRCHLHVTEVKDQGQEFVQAWSAYLLKEQERFDVEVTPLREDDVERPGLSKF